MIGMTLAVVLAPWLLFLAWSPALASVLLAAALV